jgi:hypothetical protein
MNAAAASRRSTAVLAAAFSMCLAATQLTTAHAQQWSAFPEQPRRDPDELVVYGPGAPKITPGGALGTSALSTFAPIAMGFAFGGREQAFGATLVTAGILIGPSAGYHAAGLKQRGNTGVLIRTVFTAVCLGSLVAASGHRQQQPIIYEGSYSGRHDDYSAEYLALGSAIVVTGSALWDIIAVANDVEKARAKHRWIEARNDARVNEGEASAGWSIREDDALGVEDQPLFLPDNSSYLKQSSTWSFTTPTACR